MPETKICTKCEMELPLDAFSKSKRTKDGLQYCCRVCNKLYWQTHKEELIITKRIYNQTHRAEQRAYYLQKLYGLTSADFVGLWDKQSGLCVTCCTPLNLGTKGGCAVDRDHTTGKVRGLLCARCNLILGKAYDDPQTLINLTNYLLQTSGSNAEAQIIIKDGNENK